MRRTYTVNYDVPINCSSLLGAYSGRTSAASSTGSFDASFSDSRGLEIKSSSEVESKLLWMGSFSNEADSMRKFDGAVLFRGRSVSVVVGFPSTTFSFLRAPFSVSEMN